MTRPILGLDIGGANLKAATPDGRAVSVPFALWKQSDRLPAALAEVVAKFSDTGELAVTMTGELCDCYETKREGVNAILDAVETVAAGRPVRVWGTVGEFLTVAAAQAAHMTVAAANWHALATFAGRFVPSGVSVLIDIGSTTTDIVPLENGRPVTRGLTDTDRLTMGELVYTGARRTPVCALLGEQVAAELFATMLDVYLILGYLADDPLDHDTADGRPATARHAAARLARMLGGDAETIPVERIRQLCGDAAERQYRMIQQAVEAVTETCGWPRTWMRSGVGTFAYSAGVQGDGTDELDLSAQLGAAVSASAPAYAVAVLASERPL